MNNCVAKYRKKLAKKLLCDKKVKRRLLGEFDKSVQGYIEDNDIPTEDALLNAFGPPEELAALMMERTTQRERQHYVRIVRAQKVAALLMATILLVFTAYVFFLKEFRIHVVDEIYIVDGIPSSDMTEPIEDTP